LNASRIKITLSTERKPIPAPDAPEVLAHKACTDHMISARWTAESGWGNPTLIPYRPLALAPIASTLHYATQCFEGMKVYRGYDGKLRLFRPTLNCARMLSSSERIGLPRFNPDELHRLIHKLCAVEGPRWLSADRGGECMYIRPTLVGTGEGLGLAAPPEAHLYIVLSYWPSPTPSPSPKQEKTLRLWCSTDDMVRAWPGGTGNVKVGANYGPSLYGHQKALEAGYDQVLWLFGPDRQITEAGATNFFIIWESPDDGHLQLITSPLEDNITLPGITRRSILELARERLSDAPLQVNMDDGSSRIVEPLEVVEERFTIHDVVNAAEEGRLRGAFSSGTAFFIVPVSCVKFQDTEVRVPVDDVPYAAVLRQWMADIVYGKKESRWTEVVEE
ncbi:branched-chain amino acid aminotransferase II, partial [Aspergillus heteromorphus CBS 117.55]